jgi:general secretion pathway protein E
MLTLRRSLDTPRPLTALEERLTGRGLASAETLARVWEMQQRTGQRLSRILLDLGILSQEQLFDIYSDHTGLPRWDGQGEVDTGEETAFPHEFLVYNHVLPIRQEDRTILVIDDPEDDGLINLLKRRAAHLPIEICPGDKVTFLLEGSFEVDNEHGKEGGGASPTLDIQQLKDLALEAPIIRLVSDLISSGVMMGASDIHLEPYKNRIELRYRVDGVLHNRQAMSLDDYPAVISRIKILADLDIAERRAAQDGRIRLRTQGRDVDIRVSTIPTPFGEDVVLRILDQKRQSLSLPDSGLSDHVVQMFRRNLSKSYGMILITGPTGSGKTTTLYSGIKEIVDGKKKIITVEDPVEYELPGISQIQVNEAAGIGFANALRSILRHDPDVIFIGEIRDRETAELAVQAALTGHLVLSSVHTNDAVGAVGRFLDMGVADYLLASCLIAVSAQRLVRTLCPHCRTTTLLDDELCNRFGTPVGTQVYTAIGCAKCTRTGYLGRQPIAEFLEVDGGFRHTILHDPNPDALTKAARQASAFKSLLEDGIEKAVAGLTSIEEVLRVAG